MERLSIISVCLFLLINQSESFLLSRDLPCKYLDSINITDGVRQHDDSIVYDNIIFPKDQYTKVNYKLEKGEERVTVDPYIRGCLCNKKPCIRLCCPIGMFYDPTVNGSQKCRKHEAAKRFKADLINEQNKIENVILDERFAYVSDRPCNRVFLATNYNVTITHVIYLIDIFFESYQ